jgi:4-hydroxybenzoate polyprenyltransferase
VFVVRRFCSSFLFVVSVRRSSFCLSSIVNRESSFFILHSSFFILHSSFPVSLRTYLSFIRFSHSVFALPFALTGALLATRRVPFSWGSVIWIVVAMVAARSAAMGFNRLVDADFDGQNPRTAMREIPRGVISRPAATLFVVVASLVFIAASAALSRLCLLLSPVALAIVFWYSLAKRFTTYTQAFLGLAMAVAPVGGWLAAGGRDGIEPWLLGLGIGLWVGGFDVLYACPDVEFDRAHGLNSIPVRFGVPGSLVISRAMHVGAVAAMTALGVFASLGPVYLAGVAAVAVLLVYEQSLVRADDLSQVKRAFDLNGYVGLLYLASTAAAIYIR